MINNHFEILKLYLSEHYNFPPEKLTLSTSLYNDLHIYGDDVDEFLGKLITDFQIDVKEIDLSNFFVGNEPWDFFSPLIRFFKNEKASHKPTITIDVMIRFIETGIIN